MIWKGSQLAVFYLRSTLILNGLTMNHVVVINIRNETYNSFQVSRPLAFCCKKAVLRKFAKFTGKHQCQSVFFNKIVGLRSATLLKKETLAQVFSCKFCEISENILFRNFAKFTGKHLCQSLFFNKVAVLRPATLLKKRLCHKFFPVNFAKFLRKPSLQTAPRRLHLYHIS